MKNVIWLQNINTIGGVGSVMWNVIKKYHKEYDISIWYNSADPEQIKRMSQYVKMIKFNSNQKIICDKLFINYGYDMIKNHYIAKEKYYLIHADYEYQNLNCVTEPDFKYLAVSKFAADAYYRKSGIMPELFPNPILIEPYTNALLIVSATRISPDKGKMVWRMETLAKRLDERNIPFLWLVFTNSKDNIKNKSVINVPSRLDIIPFLAKADFVAQLSDSEACCMTALETASVGTPMLLTKIPSFYEQGITKDKAIYFDFDMSNIDECIDEMLNKKFNFKFKAKKDKWGEIMEKGFDSQEVKVKVLVNYLDLVLNTTVQKDQELIMDLDRAKYLKDKNLVEIIEEEKNHQIKLDSPAFGLDVEEPKPKKRGKKK